MSDHYDDFLNLSAALTGFTRVDLQGTGVVEEQWNTFSSRVPDSVRNELFQAWQSIQGSAQALDDALQQEIFDKPELCRTAQTLIKSWYTGQWGNDALQTISGETYKEGLIWRAINAHPQGAKQQGFGTWSYPPNYLEDRS